MRSRLRYWKYPITIVLLLLITAAFTLVYTLSETAAAPYEQNNSPDNVIEEIPEPHDPADDLDPLNDPENDPEKNPEDDPGDEQEEPLLLPAEEGFITMRMDASDIHRGYLILINHDHEFSIPEDIDLVNIAEAKSSPYRVQSESFRLSSSIIQPLDEMMDDFLAATRMNSVAIISAFRNYENQQRILNNYIARMGRREALRWASLPGHSEHHTGLAFDFGILSGGSRSTFTGTGTTAWFRRNSYKYGFILRYPPNKSNITRTAHEPWHFRYVGLPHSYIMFQNNWCFEEYHEILRNHSFQEPFEAEHEGILYEIYFTSDAEVKLPLNSEFDISGNNVDGFIVTAVRLESDLSVEIEI